VEEWMTHIKTLWIKNELSWPKSTSVPMLW